MYRNNGLIYKIYITLFIFGIIYGAKDSVQITLNNAELASGGYCQCLSDENDSEMTYEECVALTECKWIAPQSESSGNNYIYYIIIFLIIIGYFFNSTLKQVGQKNTFNFFNSIHKMIINHLIQNNYNQNNDFKNLTDDTTTKELFQNINSVKTIELVLIKKNVNQVDADIFLGINDKDEQIDVKISKSYSWNQIPENYRTEFINTGKTKLRFRLYD